MALHERDPVVGIVLAVDMGSVTLVLCRSHQFPSRVILRDIGTLLLRLSRAPRAHLKNCRIRLCILCGGTCRQTGHEGEQDEHTSLHALTLSGLLADLVVGGAKFRELAPPSTHTYQPDSAPWSRTAHPARYHRIQSARSPDRPKGEVPTCP